MINDKTIRSWILQNVDFLNKNKNIPIIAINSGLFNCAGDDNVVNNVIGDIKYYRIHFSDNIEFVEFVIDWRVYEYYNLSFTNRLNYVKSYRFRLDDTLPFIFLNVDLFNKIYYEYLKHIKYAGYVNFLIWLFNYVDKLKYEIRRLEDINFINPPIY